MASVTVQYLRCEHVDTPLIVHRDRPRLSWKLAALDGGARDLKQTAYRVLVASTAEQLNANTADLWDSKRIPSDQNLVLYAGKPLVSRQRCYWKVGIWNNQDSDETWSEAARFEMGLLAPADWTAKWIESPDASCRSPLFRKRLELPRRPNVARAYLCGLGYSELYINGHRVGDRVLD